MTIRRLKPAGRPSGTIIHDNPVCLAGQVFLADIGYFAAMNRAWDARFDTINPPAPATVEARRVDPSWMVKITPIAAP